MIDILSISCEIVLRWMPQDLSDDKLILIQVMAGWQQAITWTNVEQICCHIVSHLRTCPSHTISIVHDDHLAIPRARASSGLVLILLTHWGWVTHICVSKLTIIGSDNGLLPGRRQAIIWTNAGMLLTGSLGTNFSEILMCEYWTLLQQDSIVYHLKHVIPFQSVAMSEDGTRTDHKASIVENEVNGAANYGTDSVSVQQSVDGSTLMSRAHLPNTTTWVQVFFPRVCTSW